MPTQNRPKYMLRDIRQFEKAAREASTGAERLKYAEAAQNLRRGLAMKEIADVCDGHTNDGQRITAPGKFEGEPIFAPHFWNIALEGFADSDDGNVFTFRITQQDRQEIPGLDGWLGHKFALRLREDDQGFVHCF